MSDTVPQAVVLAYDAAKDILSGQDATLGNIRTRASGVIGIAAVLTSFSAGIGLVNTDPTKGFVLPASAAWLLLGIIISIGALSLYILWPVKVWHFGPGARLIYNQYKAGQEELEIRHFITEAMLDGVDSNAAAIRGRQAAFRVAVGLLVAEAVVLVAALTLFR